MKKIGEIPQMFPLICDYQHWENFFRKALMGSYKTADMLYFSESAIMIYTFGKDIEIDEKKYDKESAKRINENPIKIHRKS